MVDRLIDDGWFISTVDDRLMLSIKTLCELKEYLIETYGVNGDDTDADGRCCCVHNAKKLSHWAGLYLLVVNHFIENVTMYIAEQIKFTPKMNLIYYVLVQILLHYKSKLSKYSASTSSTRSQ